MDKGFELMELSKCDICKKDFPTEELWCFRRNLDDASHLELWCAGCYVPYMQKELDLADMLVLKYSQILGVIAKELSENPMQEGNNAALYLITQSLRAKPDRQKHLDRLISLLVARMNYNNDQLREVLQYDHGWKDAGGGVYRKTIVTVNYDTREKEQREVEALGPIAAVEHDIRKIVEEVLGEELWSASRSK